MFSLFAGGWGPPKNNYLILKRHFPSIQLEDLDAVQDFIHGLGSQVLVLHLDELVLFQLSGDNRVQWSHHDHHR